MSGNDVVAFPRSFHMIRDVPLHILTAELAARQDNGERPACGSRGPGGHYNTFLHVGALVLILVLSTAACSFPIIARRFPGLPIPHRMLFLSRHFGTGVLIATAFIHLLPTAFISLTDPCLPPFWNRGYPPMAGCIAMVSVLVVVGIEMFFATRGAGHIHGSEYDMVQDESSNGLLNTRHAVPRAPHRSGAVGQLQRRKRFSQSNIEAGFENVEGKTHDHIGAYNQQLEGDDQAYRTHSSEEDMLPLNVRNSLGEDNESESDLDLDELDVEPNAAGHAGGTRIARGSIVPGLVETRSQLATGGRAEAENPTVDTHEQQKLLLQCLLLEAGILFHSIFIGMALSVATGTSFIVLLVAISFHQTFEGFALGSRIAAITVFGSGSPKPWLMALAYGTTTPIGQAIGLVVHNMYDPMSETGLLMVGIMNAISSGLLLFAGLVELLAEDFLSDKSYETLQGKKRVHACAAVVGGAVLMALVGAFA